MSPSGPISYRRYLAAKKSVDDRALNPRVIQALQDFLHTWSAPAPLTILEAGCGLGTMVERLLGWDLPPRVHYTGVDCQGELLREAEVRLSRLARPRGWRAERQGDGLELSRPGRRLVLNFREHDLCAATALHPPAASCHLLVAHHVLDLFNLEEVLPRLFTLLAPGGRFLFTLNFDGATIFLPVFCYELDAAIQRLYHQSMEHRPGGPATPGACHTGRRLPAVLSRHGAAILASGPSPWMVRPHGGSYPADEAYFLHCLVQMVEDALAGSPDLEPEALQWWVAARRRQIDAGELSYAAAHRDFFGRRG
ncbi:MAG: class I SAM-dependent methyltransferase [Deltaproteobacteria bacterium]|nr:class I SAM-dependent methyltransferase [Deltaproteobacteria bacterium]